MAAMEPKPKKLPEDVILKFKNIKVSRLGDVEVKKDYLECPVFLFFFYISAMILFSDKRRGGELHVLERLQRKVKNCNTSFTFLRIFLFFWSSVCIYVPANIFREFSWSLVACWLYLRMSSYFPVVVGDTFTKNCYFLLISP